MSNLLSRHETEQKIPCPYDPSHDIAASKMQTHLTGCRRQHLSSDMVTCIYNATHRIPKHEEASHLEDCEDRKNLDKFAYLPDDVDFDKYPTPTVEMEYTEIWDDNAPTYNPTAYCESQPILRTTSTLSAAARREFKESERRRRQDLQNIYQRPLSHNSASCQPTQSSANANTSKQIDEDDPYKVQMLMNQISNVRQEGHQANQPQSSVWGNSSTATRQDADLHGFPPLNGNGGGARNYRGRGRGRR